MDWLDWMAAGVILERELLLLASVGIALAGIDDLFVDLVYLGRSLWRRLVVYNRYERASARDLDSTPPRPIAILVPAWDEAEVIGPMLALMLERFSYPDYRIFVGTYPNDPATGAAVDAIGDPRIIRAECEGPGPTTKAACLNRLWRAVLAEEARLQHRFRAIVLHDAEDVVHSRELHVFNHLIDKRAMVQVPVVPLREADSWWIAGHYIDEFAEHHGKDIVVREAIGAGLPSAGVGCAFDRDLLARAMAPGTEGPFDAASLTEDYELGMRLRALGASAALVRIPGEAGGGMVVTREHFPDTLETALRQKSRWLLGIALMGWQRVGWHGGLADRYMLVRDRKALLTALLSMLGYVAAIGWAAVILLRWLVPAAHALPPIVPEGLFLYWLLWFNLGLLLWRLGMRAFFTGRIYGAGEALLSIPRAFVGNVINFLAAVRALRRYLRIRAGDERLVWDKTAHRFPDAVPAE